MVLNMALRWPVGLQAQVSSDLSPGVGLHGSNPEPLMSALGQKRTSELVQAMSALPPKADIGTGTYHLRRDNSGSLAIFAATRRAYAGYTQDAASSTDLNVLY
jgi:hypothetical protein